MKEHHLHDNKNVNVNKSDKEIHCECELYKCKTNKNDNNNNNNQTYLFQGTSNDDTMCNDLKKTFNNNYVCNQIDKSATSTLFTPANRIIMNNNSTHHQKYFNKESCSLQEFVKNVKLYCKWWNIDRMADNYLHTLRHTLQEAENALVEKTLSQESIACDEMNTRKQEKHQETSRSVHVHTHSIVSEDSALEAILQLRLHAAQERSTNALLQNERFERELETYHTIVEEQNKMLELFYTEQEHQQEQHEEQEHEELQHLKRKEKNSKEVHDEELISAKVRAQLARARQLRVEQLQYFYPVTLCNASTHENTSATNKTSTKTLINGANKISSVDKGDNNEQQTELRENTEFIAQWRLPYFNLSICTLPSKHFGNLYKYNNKYTYSKNNNRLGNDTKNNYIGSKYNNRMSSDLVVNNNTRWKDFTSLKASGNSTSFANERNNDINNNLNFTNTNSLSSSSLSTHNMTRQVETPWVISHTIVRDDVDGEGNALVCAGRVLRTLAEVYSISLPHPIILSGVHSYVCSLYPSRSVDNNRWQSSSTSNTTLPCTTQNAMLQKCKMYTDKMQPQESCQMQT